jgi:hypothetical protein
MRRTSKSDSGKQIVNIPFDAKAKLKALLSTFNGGERESSSSSSNKWNE